MLKNKPIDNIMAFYQELRQFQDLWANFFQNENDKTNLRNAMMDDHLNDLCVLAIECDIDVNFDQLIDDFTHVL